MYTRVYSWYMYRVSHLTVEAEIFCKLSISFLVRHELFAIPVTGIFFFIANEDLRGGAFSRKRESFQRVSVYQEKFSRFSNLERGVSGWISRYRAWKSFYGKVNLWIDRKRSYQGKDLPTDLSRLFIKKHINHIKLSISPGRLVRMLLLQLYRWSASLEYLRKIIFTHRWRMQTSLNIRVSYESQREESSRFWWNLIARS